jgi:hypothetical protein
LKRLDESASQSFTLFRKLLAEEQMPRENCPKCGERMTEQSAAYETLNLPDVPMHSARFYEQWFVCPNGHKKGYISGHGPASGDATAVSEMNVVSLHA